MRRCERPATTSGRRPKPHLVTYRERIRIDGRPIAPDDFARLVGRVLAIADRVAPRHGEPTEFELLTAVVFARFAEVRPDVALVEVGLGGRLDATHAWDGGVAVVTNVDLDHMDRLGDTVTKIAREKAAIIERGDLAVTGARGDGLAVIRRRARRMAVPLTMVEPRAAARLGPRRDRGGAAPAWAGRGSGCAAATRRPTSRSPTRCSTRSRRPGSRRSRAAARRTGYATARWPGRLELLRVRERDVLLDGAHNPAGRRGARASPSTTSGRTWRTDRSTLVTASMADKDVDGVIAALVGAALAARGHASCARAWLSPGRCRPTTWPRAGARTHPDGRSSARTIAIEPTRSRRSTARWQADGPVVVAGSLYLVGSRASSPRRRPGAA